MKGELIKEKGSIERFKQYKLKKLMSTAENLNQLIDDIVKNARKTFKTTGEADLDAKALKESVAALRELYFLLEECGVDKSKDETDNVPGVIIKMEKPFEEWSK